MEEIKIEVVTLLIIVIAFSPLILLMPVNVQPTWSFKIHILPAELYMGEWGRIYVNITNMDCESRRDYILELKSAPEEYIEEILSRAGEMNETGLIEDYTIQAEKLWGTGGKIFGDYKLNLYRVCYGRSIEVVRVGVWYPFKGIARSMTFWNDTSIMLQAFNPLNYILNGSDPYSTEVLEFRVYIPEDIPPGEVSLKPGIDVRVRFPGWLEYTLESYRVELNEAEIKPYRSFNLTITDFDGLNPIGDAKVVITRLVYYYEKREYITSENGTLKIVRLPDDKYEVAVYYNSSLYRQELPFIHYEQHWAYELASSKVIKTRLFNLKIKTLDLKDSPLNGSR